MNSEIQALFNTVRDINEEIKKVMSVKSGLLEAHAILTIRSNDKERDREAAEKLQKDIDRLEDDIVSLMKQASRIEEQIKAHYG